MVRKIRSQKPIIYIFCEGLTEKKYFTQLSRVLDVHFNIICENLKGGTKIMEHPEKIIKKIKGTVAHDKTSGLTQAVFVIFDLDIFIDKTKLEKMQNTLKNYHLIFNNNCFEYWILSHFEKYDLGNGKDRYLGKIKNHISISNDKFTGRNDFYWLNKENIKSAIKHTKEVNANSSGNLKNRDPYSNVYEVIEFLEK